ncbi:endonuclease [Caerostris extrusa]|uniref:Endonuclease n=1 Tax=Caerostris extrusa TaxID=172846 RepID=A0AAV4V5Z9_CAEEX|nr:endonuclease [Caerostris extrusa]
MNFYSISIESQPTSLFKVSICGSRETVFAGTRTTYSIGEKLYHFLKKSGLIFNNGTVDMALADGHVQKTEILTTTVDIDVKGKVIPATLIVLKTAKGNRIRHEADFLVRQESFWIFRKHIDMSQELLTNNLISLQLLQSLWEMPPASHPCTPASHFEKMGVSISQNNNGQNSIPCSKDMKNVSNQGKNQPLSSNIESILEIISPFPVPPYRMSPAKKEILKQEIDRLLAEGIIEQCESLYASPVVLILKSNGTMRLCIDDWKLNSITVPDSYPLPRIDDLLNSNDDRKPVPEFQPWSPWLRDS